MEKLSKIQVQRDLKGLKGWSLRNGRLERIYSFRDFKEAILFVAHVSLIAEHVDHHPDIDIRYNRVTLKLSTHSAKGITSKDFNLARKIDS